MIYDWTGWVLSRISFFDPDAKPQASFALLSICFGFLCSILYSSRWQVNLCTAVGVDSSYLWFLQAGFFHCRWYASAVQVPMDLQRFCRIQIPHHCFKSIPDGPHSILQLWETCVWRLLAHLTFPMSFAVSLCPCWQWTVGNCIFNDDPGRTGLTGYTVLTWSQLWSVGVQFVHMKLLVNSCLVSLTLC